MSKYIHGMTTAALFAALGLFSAIGPQDENASTPKEIKATRFVLVSEEGHELAALESRLQNRHMPAHVDLSIRNPNHPADAPVLRLHVDGWGKSSLTMVGLTHGIVLGHSGVAGFFGLEVRSGKGKIKYVGEHK